MTPNTYPVWSYLVYVAISVALTVWVARTLHRNGRIFLVDAFHGNEGAGRLRQPPCSWWAST